MRDIAVRSMPWGGVGGGGSGIEIGNKHRVNVALASSLKTYPKPFQKYLKSRVSC